MSSNEYLMDEYDVRAFANLLLAGGGVVEFRALGVTTSDYGRPHIQSGYFDNADDIVKVTSWFVGRATGIYLTLNPVDPALLARAANRIAIPEKGAATGDNNVTRRLWLPIDIDPVRPSGISSTDEEHELALAKAIAIAAHLKERGWPAPLQADSGNGAHALYAIDLPNDDASRNIVKNCLTALAAEFNDEKAKVDESVFNAARIWKLPGTWARKGDDVPGRPHRPARLLNYPDELQVVTVEQLTALAASAPAAEPRSKRDSASRREASRTDSQERRTGFNLGSWLVESGLEVDDPRPWHNGLLWQFRVCPWNPEHTNGSAWVAQFPTGAVAAGCHHEGCRDNDWHALRRLVEGEELTSAGAGAACGQGMFALTDTGNAERLVAAFGQDVRYVPQGGYWMAWDETRWRKDDTGHLMRLAKAVARSIYREAAGAVDDDSRAEIASHAKASESEKRRKAMVALASVEAAVVVTPDQLDADPWVLNVLNGTLDLRTGILRPHNRQNLITKLAPVVWDPTARSEVFDGFLARVLPDVALRSFTQRMMGYGLTGSTAEEKLFLLNGPEATGKTTYIESMKGMLGDYVVTTDFDTFLATRSGGGPRNDLARLAGARIVVSVEVAEGQHLAEAVVKQLTGGGDTVTARFLYKEFFEYVPSFKLFLAANHRPTVNHDDGAMWRRILQVPFVVQIPAGERDPSVKQKLRHDPETRSAILAWAVQGCLDWQRDGLGVPPAVIEATDAYRNEMDRLAEFVEDCCVVSPDAWVSAGDLRLAYENWCRRTGERFPCGRNRFGERLKARGFKPGKRDSGTRRVWQGIGLAAGAPVDNGTHGADWKPKFDGSPFYGKTPGSQESPGVPRGPRIIYPKFSKTTNGGNS
jgi:P4 family phage/plasmid primase-like protien